MKEEDETVFEYFQRGEIEYLQAMNDVLSERVKFLEKTYRHILNPEYMILIDVQFRVIDDYRIFLDNFKGVEMYLEEFYKETNTTPPTKQ